MEQLNPNSIKSPHNFRHHQINQNSMKTLLLSDKLSQTNLIEWPIKVNFPGLYKLHQNWGNWVEKLSLKHAKTWEITGICDGILSSLHEIKPNPDIVLGLCEFWCSETNTFVFPWGEAAITLEDVCILAGFSVVGESVNLPVSGNLCKNLEGKLHRVRRKLVMNSFDRNASDSEWIKRFCEENVDVEHVGFLAFWLSRFVFPDLGDNTVGQHVFSIAVNLARGVKIALAPAVLAYLYNNLTFLSHHAADFDSNKKEVSIPGPFQIVQLWALERFPMLGSKLSKPLSLGQPRIARWDNVGLTMNLVDVRSMLRSSDGFCWRPYALELENWRPRTCSLENGKVVSGCLDDDNELLSFRVFVQPQKLVGIDGSAMYFPQRGSRQFEREQEFALGPKQISMAPVLQSKHVENLCDKSMRDNGNVIQGHVELVGSETLKACSYIDARKRNNCEGKENQNLENLVIVDSDEDEEASNKLGNRNVSLRSVKNAKRKIGDSADNPLYVSDRFGKAHYGSVIRSGMSYKHPVDVENYYHYSD